MRLWAVIALLLAGCDLYFDHQADAVPDAAGSASIDATERVSCDGFWDGKRQCPYGQFCLSDNTCAVSCTCYADVEAVAHHWGWCDEERSTCMPGLDLVGTCGGNPAGCARAQPNMTLCPEGGIATVDGNGCWTGRCHGYESCDVTPACERIGDEAQCVSRSDCVAVYYFGFSKCQ